MGIFNKKNKKINKMENNLHTIPFLAKTYEILKNNDLKDIICWADDGYGFIIKDITKFEQEVLPLYFKTKKMSSFVRQLNLHDFHIKRFNINEKFFKHTF